MQTKPHLPAFSVGKMSKSPVQCPSQKSGTSQSSHNRSPTAPATSQLGNSRPILSIVNREGSQVLLSKIRPPRGELGTW